MAENQNAHVALASQDPTRSSLELIKTIFEMLAEGLPLTFTDDERNSSADSKGSDRK